MNTEADYRRRAHEAFDTDDVTVNETDAEVHIEGNGAWVAGWLWIDAAEPTDPDDIEAEEELDDGPREDEDEVDEAALNRARFFGAITEAIETIESLGRSFPNGPRIPTSSPHDDGAP
jgi:hypothetical protein